MDSNTTHIGPEPPRPIDAGAPHRPHRTCVGCKQVDLQAGLWRAVADAAGRLRFDSRQRESGRGVYVHRRYECMQAALRGGFSRSLRRKVVVSDAAVLSELGLPGQSAPRKSGATPDLLVGSTQARVKNQDNHS
jgi:predicted RNA-binding protein YlxR (DUF448 family)